MTNKGSILIVDDSPSVLELLGYFLTAEGYEVRPVNSGELCLSQATSKPPDLILLDIIMEGMDGFEILRRLKADEVTRHIPVIMVSSMEEEERWGKCFELGAVDYVSKPIKKEELLARIKVHLDLGRLRAQLEKNIIDLRSVEKSLLYELTNKDRVNEELLRNEARQLALLGLNQKSELSSGEIANYALETAIELTDSKIGYIAFVNEDESVLTMQCWSKTAMEQCAIIDKPIVYVVKDTGLWGEAVRQRKAIINNDYAAPHPAKKGTPEGHVELKRHMNIPVFDGKKIVAVVGVGNKETDYTQADVTQLTLMMEGMWRITCRKRAEEESHRSKKLLQRIIDLLPIRIFWKDKDLRYLGCNEIFAKDAGRNRSEDLIGKDDFQMGWKEQAKIYRDDDQKVIDSGTARFNYEEPQTAPNGDKIWLRTTKVPLTDTEGNLIGVLGAYEDISERKQTEEALRESEKRFMDVLYASQDAILIINSEKFVDCNEATARMLGYLSREEFLMTHPSELSPPVQPDGRNSFEKANEMMRIAHEKGFHRFEWAHRKANGEDFPVEVSLTPILIQGKNVLYCVWRDITERKKAEEALIVSEVRYRRLFEAAKDGVLIIDANTGLVLDVNPFLTEILGYSLEHFIGKTVWELGPFKDIVANRDNFLELQSKGYIRYEDLPLETKDGRRIDVEFVSNVYLVDRQKVIQCNIRDITQRKQMEKELARYQDHLEDIIRERTELLQESEERYKKITSSITDYIFHVQIENGRPVATTYSPGCLRVTGYSSEDFLSNSSLWVQIVVEDDRHIVERQIQDVFSGVKPTPIEHRIRHKDGHICWVSNTIVCQYDTNGKLFGYDGLIADISERKKSEEVLNEAKEIAEQALAIKDEFTSTVSHELRTPLAAIKSSIDIMDMGIPGELNKDQKVFVKRVKSNIDRLSRLINDVLDLTKLESGKMVMNLMPLRAESIIQEVVEMQGPLVKSKGLTITTEFGENLPGFIADKDRLFQVFNNLINNALKFTKEGGIVVAAHSEDNQSLKFSVRDTGIGIKEEDLSKLFQKFQQVGAVSQQVAGTGLGLSICKLIIAKHRGRIWVESQFGRGSTFCFNIPVRKGKRILIVDDDDVTMEVLKSILEAEDLYEIEMASDGFRAGEKYYDFSPQLIILDINLPKINGLEVCSRIKKDPKTKHTKIIIISSFNEQKKKEAWDAGADETMNKPINPEELMAKVRKLI